MFLERQLVKINREVISEVFKMNMKNMVFVGLLLVSVILFMGLKDETHPKWEYGQLWFGYDHNESEIGTYDLSWDYKDLTKVDSLPNLTRSPYRFLQHSQVLTTSILDKDLQERVESNRSNTRIFLENIGLSDDEIESLPMIGNSFGVVGVMSILGNQGWELITSNILDDQGTGYYNFKRRIQ